MRASVARIAKTGVRALPRNAVYGECFVHVYVEGYVQVVVCFVGLFVSKQFGQRAGYFYRTVR